MSDLERIGLYVRAELARLERVDLEPEERARDEAADRAYDRSVEDPVDDDEPAGAGADPFGRPDPRTHPEFWTE